MIRSLPSSKLRAAGIAWLLEVDLCGVVYRFSSIPVEVFNDDGSSFYYAGGLDAEDLDYAEKLDRLAGEASGQEVSLEVVFPVDMAQAHRRGRLLTASTGDLSIITVQAGEATQTREARVVVVKGDLRQPEWGHPAKPSGWAAFTIAPDTGDDVARILGARQRVGAFTFPLGATTAQGHLWTTDSDVVRDNFGKPYPIILGNPGRWRAADDAAWQVTAGSPAYCLSYWEPQDPVVRSTGPPAEQFWTEILLIAGHHVTANYVSIIAKDAIGSYVAQPVNAIDRFGEPIAYVEITGAGPIYGDAVNGYKNDIKQATEFWVAWGRDTLSITGAGYHNPFGPSDLRGAGDVIRWALVRSSIAIDHGAWAAVAPFLNAWKIGTYINDPDVSPWAWVQEALLPLLPLSVRFGPDGLYPILHDTGLQSGEALIELTQGNEVRRTSAVQAQQGPADVVTTITLEYSPRASGTDDYQRVVVVGLADLSDTATTETVHSRVGRLAYPGDRFRTESAPVIYDDATAARVARWMMRESSQIGHTVSYLAAPALGHLEIGQMIALTDHELGPMTRQPAEIIGKEWAVTGWRLTLYLIEDPARDDRS